MITGTTEVPHLIFTVLISRLWFLRRLAVEDGPPGRGRRQELGHLGRPAGRREKTCRHQPHRTAHPRTGRSCWLLVAGTGRGCWL